jgi:hypothetical protein
MNTTQIGIFFWGFQDLTIVAKCAKHLKISHGIKKFYMQISPQEKTISLLEIFPEEIVRCEHNDFNFFYKWLHEHKNIIVVFDAWPLLLSKNFNTNINILKKILNLPSSFLICCPQFFRNNSLLSEEKKLLYLVDKTQHYFQKVSTLYEIAFNGTASIFMLSFAPCLWFLNFICGKDLWTFKRIGSIIIEPQFLFEFGVMFMSTKDFLIGLEKKIIEISKEIKTSQKQSYPISFRNSLQGEVFHKNFQMKQKKQYFKKLLSFSLSLERFYQLKNKEDVQSLLWLIYLGILEYQENFGPKQTRKGDLFSNISM